MRKLQLMWGHEIEGGPYLYAIPVLNVISMARDGTRDESVVTRDPRLTEMTSFEKAMGTRIRFLSDKRTKVTKRLVIRRASVVDTIFDDTNECGMLLSRQTHTPTTQQYCALQCDI